MYLEWYQIAIVLAIGYWLHHQAIRSMQQRYESLCRAFEGFVEHVNAETCRLDDARSDFVTNYAHLDKIDLSFPEDLDRWDERHDQAIEALKSFGFERLKTGMYKFGDVARGVYQ